MNLSSVLNSIAGKNPAETKEIVMELYSSMPPDIFFEHLKNLQNMAQQHGEEKAREEIVCRLLASGISAEEIAVILCVRADNIRIIESNNTAIKIPEYAKKLKERRRRRERQPK